MDTEKICCPEFNPAPWDQKEIHWQKKKFTTDRVRSFFHIPLNFGAVMKRMMTRIETSQVKSEEMIVLADEDSLWGTNVFVDVSGDVVDGKMVEISGTFISKVFEGPYRNMRMWIKEMARYVEAQDRQIENQYFYYTTCPKCARKYGKNYVVLLAEVT